MSKFVRIATQFKSLALLKTSLQDLNVPYREDAQFRHHWSGFSGTVPLVVNLSGVLIGFRPTAGDTYEIIGDDSQIARAASPLDRIRQRYAYHSVLEQTASAGFELVETTTDRNNVIRMTVRRWS
jgi:hypothetical protein